LGKSERAYQMENGALVLAQRILDMLDGEGASGMEQWNALNIALRLVDIHKPEATSEATSSASPAAPESWPTELGPT
jgi:glucose-6-phosphate isomerase